MANDTQLVEGLVAVCLHGRRATPKHKDEIDARVRAVLAKIGELRAERDEWRARARGERAEMMKVVGDWGNMPTDEFRAKYGTARLPDALRTGPLGDA